MGNTVIFDFYLNDNDVVTGRIQDFRDSKILIEVKNEFKKESDLKNLYIKESEQNFGYSVDWPQIIVEWLAKDNWVNAISNLGELITFSSYFYLLFQRLKNKYKDNLRVGLASSKLIALNTIFKREKENSKRFNYEILFEKEISRQEAFEEKDFMFVIRRTLEGKDLVIFFIHIDWLGNIKIFYEI